MRPVQTPCAQRFIKRSIGNRKCRLRINSHFCKTGGGRGITAPSPQFAPQVLGDGSNPHRGSRKACPHGAPPDMRGRTKSELRVPRKELRGQNHQAPKPRTSGGGCAAWSEDLTCSRPQRPPGWALNCGCEGGSSQAMTNADHNGRKGGPSSEKEAGSLSSEGTTPHPHSLRRTGAHCPALPHGRAGDQSPSVLLSLCLQVTQ